MTTPELLLWILAGILVLVGVAGTVLPALPGPVLVFAGLLVGAWADGFERVGGVTLGVLAFLTALTFAADLAASAFGARRLGASQRAVLGAAVGALVGLFFGLPGLLLGPLIGAVIGEYTAQRNLGHAGRAGIGAVLGIALGAAAKIALVFAMLGIFAWRLLAG
jgi:uncharacterized protein YqgC (DUF456 family)